MSASSSHAIRLGTRASKLARWQADWVAARLRDLGHTIEIVEITTAGDVEQVGPVADIGAPGVFTKEIQRAVLEGEVDFAVHSLKDLPTDEIAGLTLAAVPPRETSADVLIARDVDSVDSFDALPKSARIGTGSLRRQSQLRHARPDLRVESVRGNVDTRVRKLDEGQFDAIVLAEAGLKRLGLSSRISQVLPLDVMLPAVGQGALGIECRRDDLATFDALAVLNDASSRAAVLAERALLAHLRGGCLAPIGALARIENGRLHLAAVVLNPAGSRRIFASDDAPPADAISLGRRVAVDLLAQGAAELIASSRLGFPA
jgi:hydroxymethylbilane synthase